MNILFINKRIKIALFLCIVFCLIINFSLSIQINFSGDFGEYVLTSEAISNHFTTDIQPSDAQSVVDKLKMKIEYFYGIKYFVSTEAEANKNFSGIVKSKKEGFYTMHFWAYSYATVPAKLILHALHLNEYYCFAVTNMLLIILVIAYIFFISSLHNTIKLFTSLLFIFTGAMYYVSWMHPEVFTSAFLFLSLLTLYDKRFILSVLFASIASLQNPSIVFLLIFIASYNISIYRFNIKRLLILILIGSLSLLPFIFSYYHFGSLSAVSGAIKYEYIELDRLHSTFFDLNQGMIVLIPLILVLIPIFIVKNLIKKEITFFDLLPLVVIVISVPTLAQANWNMGLTVISRYVYWLAVPLVFYISLQFQDSKLKHYLFCFIVISQIVYSIRVAKNDNYVHHKKLSRYLLTNYPSLYNPDSEIFGERTLHHERITSSDSPIVYVTKKGNTKLMVHKEKLKDLRLDTLTPNWQSEYIQNQLRNLSFTRNWAYINLK